MDRIDKLKPGKYNLDEIFKCCLWFKHLLYS